MLTSPHRSLGLTLIELLVTVTLLGLLLIAAAPGFGTWMRNTQVRTAADAIQTGLQKARSEAVRRNEQVLFSMVAGSDARVLGNDCALSAASASWVVSLSSPEGKCSQAPSETVEPRILDKYAHGGGEPGVVVTVLDESCTGAASTPQIAFNAYGRFEPPPRGPNPIRCVEVSHIAGSSDVHKLRIVVGTGGALRMCDPDPSVKSTDPRSCQLP